MYVCCHTLRNTRHCCGWLLGWAVIALDSVPGSARTVYRTALCPRTSRQRRWLCGSRAPSKMKYGHRGIAVTKDDKA